jgi:hypothetical protein
MHDPSLEYQKRLLDRQTRLQRCFSRIRIVSYFRLGIGLVFFVTLWLVFGIRVAHCRACCCPSEPTSSYALYHDRLYRERDRAKRAVTFYERGLERIENRWQGTGNGETSDLDDTHLYAKDLDLFGRGSLFELLCTARTEQAKRRSLAGFASPRSARRSCNVRRRCRSFATSLTYAKTCPCWARSPFPGTP